MQSAEDKAAECRQQAAECVEIAQRMSLREDRERMALMAQRWLDMAHALETGGGCGLGCPLTVVC